MNGTYAGVELVAVCAHAEDGYEFRIEHVLNNVIVVKRRLKSFFLVK